MLRTALHQNHDAVDSDGVRLRGLGFSRLDGFSDVVFGFALTLIVVSLEVPKDFAELHHLWHAFLPFAVTFLLLMLIWYEHFVFFRRFGLHDAATIWLNGLLLFVVLFYVYPLKFLFLIAFGGAAALEGWQQFRELVLVFAGGQATLYFLIAGLYANALRQRTQLDAGGGVCYAHPVPGRGRYRLRRSACVPAGGGAAARTRELGSACLPPDCAAQDNYGPLQPSQKQADACGLKNRRMVCARGSLTLLALWMNEY